MLFAEHTLDAFVDAFILAGGDIECIVSGYRLAITRPMSRKSIVAWWVAILEDHQFHTHHVKTQNTVKYRTDFKPFLCPAYRRWKPDGRYLRTPNGLYIDGPTMLCWLVDAMSKRGDTDIFLTAPNMEIDVAGELVDQVRDDFGWPAEVYMRHDSSGSYCLRIPEDRRTDLESYLGKFVPRVIWDISAADEVEPNGDQLAQPEVES